MSSLHSNPFESDARGRQGAVGAIEVAGTLVAAAAILGHTAVLRERSQHSEKPIINVEQAPNSRRAVVVMAGRGTDGLVVADMLRRKVKGPNHYIAVRSPEKGFSLDAIHEGLVEKLKPLGLEETKFICFSMAGQVVANVLDDELCGATGEVHMDLDSCATGLHDLTLFGQAALELNRAFRFSYAASKLVPWVMRRSGGKHLVHSEWVSDEEIQEHIFSSALVPFHATGDQCDAISNLKVEAGSLSHVTGKVRNIRGPRDRYVKASSYDSWRAAFARQIEDTVDYERPLGNHAGGPEYQSEMQGFDDVYDLRELKPAA